MEVSVAMPPSGREVDAPEKVTPIFTCFYPTNLKFHTSDMVGLLSFH